ncbi:DUF6660 family protein [Hymenobacter algoricola]
MRLLALFFAFYFAGLSCLSCADEVAAGQNQRQTTVAARPPSDCRPAGPGDWCSPLCQCHCCGGAVLAQAPLPALAAACAVGWGSAGRPGQLVVAAPTRAFGAVWQPPRA